MSIEAAFKALSEHISGHARALILNRIKSNIAIVELEIEQEHGNFLGEFSDQLRNLIGSQIPVVTSVNEVAEQIEKMKQELEKTKEAIATSKSNANAIVKENKSLEFTMQCNVAEHQKFISQMEHANQMRNDQIHCLTNKRECLQKEYKLLIQNNSKIIAAEKRKNEEELNRLEELNESTKARQSSLDHKLKELEEEATRLQEQKQNLLNSIATFCGN